MAKHTRGRSRSKGATNNEWYGEHVEANNVRILTMLSETSESFEKGWDNEGRGGLPYNGLTGQPYSGFNAATLLAIQHERGYTDPRFFTFNQGCVQLGFRLRKGEKSYRCVKYKSMEERRDESHDGEDEEARRFLIPLPFNVFNAEQFEDMPPPPRRILRPEHERHAECERLMADSGAQIRWGGDRAFYHPGHDFIQLPERHQFHDAPSLYATAMHELAHWTGHASRLNRDMTGRFGTESYAREELNAEIASLFIGERLGIPARPANHASYLKSWHRVVADDPKAILRACSMAEKICTHLGVEKYVYEATQKAEKTAEQTRELARTATKSAEAANDDAPGSTTAHDRQRKRVAERHAGYGMSM